MQFGGWYNNPAQGGKNMRWWGGDTWTMGEDPTGGRGVNWQQGATTSTAYAPISRLGEPAFDPEAIYKSMEASRQAEQNRLRGEEESLFQKFETAQAGQEPLSTAYERMSTEQGIPGLTAQLSTVRGEVAKTGDLLDRLEEDINARTTGQLLSEPQRRRLLASEETPLRTQLGRLVTGQAEASGQLSTALQLVGNKMTYFTAEQQRQIQPILARISAFSDRAAREMSGFTEGLQDQLSLILAKIQRGQQLADQDWQQASDWSKMERQFEMDKDKIRLQGEWDVKKSLSGQSGAGGLPEMSAGEFGSMFGLEAMPTTKPKVAIGGSLNPIYSPGGQWMFDYKMATWVPATQRTGATTSTPDYSSILSQIFSQGTAGSSATLR